MGIINSVLVIFYYIGLYICIEIRASLAAAKTGNISVVLLLVRFFFCAPRGILAHLKRWGYLRRMFMSFSLGWCLVGLLLAVLTYSTTMNEIRIR